MAPGSKDDAMGKLKVLALAAATVIMTLPAANAADLPLMPRMTPVVEDFASGWYLRGDVGVGVQQFQSFDHTATNTGFVWPASWNIDSKSVNSTVFLGAGIGYQVTNWLRFDVTGEYRVSARFKAVGRYTEFCSGGGVCFDTYDGNHSSSVFLANAYLDLGTWWRITPFIGAGVGMAAHSIHDFWDLGLNSDGGTGRGFAANNTAWNMAWAVHAGFAFDVSHNLKVELAYRYLNMGDVKTAVIDCLGCGAGGPLAYYTMKRFDSHDFKLGLRWMLDAPAPVQPYPLVRKG
jgi:opacity protein-like surface antigen